MGDSPASVYRASGRVIINPAFIGKLNAHQWRFILLHENAHLLLQTSDEFAVDKLARSQYLEAGHSPKNLVLALTRPLDPQNPDHVARASAQLQDALAYDLKHPHKSSNPPKPTMDYNDETENARGRNPFRRAKDKITDTVGQFKSRAKDFARDPRSEAKNIWKDANRFARHPARMFATGFQDADFATTESYNNSHYKANFDGNGLPINTLLK